RPFICHRWSCLRCLCWGCHGSPFIWFSRSARLLQRHSFIFGNARGQQEPHVSRAAFFVFVGVVIEARFLLVTPERGQEPQRRARMPRAMPPALPIHSQRCCVARVRLDKQAMIRCFPQHVSQRPSRCRSLTGAGGQIGGACKRG